VSTWDVLYLCLSVVTTNRIVPDTQGTKVNTLLSDAVAVTFHITLVYAFIRDGCQFNNLIINNLISI
jgi:hypothetical protein